ncbi:MAG TPA: acylglycerol kinase family protein, partial [Candidatus Blautia faecigallinarum]|nr:acylglycerol kinase family protein [Candidatus Blautia faecigallinarum]
MFYFIVNPNSRSGAGKKIWDLLKKELDSRKVSYQVFMTRYMGHAVQLSQKASSLGTAEKPAYLIAVG